MVSSQVAAPPRRLRYSWTLTRQLRDHPTLSDEEREVVRKLCGGGDGISVVPRRRARARRLCSTPSARPGRTTTPRWSAARCRRAPRWSSGGRRHPVGHRRGRQARRRNRPRAAARRRAGDRRGEHGRHARPPLPCRGDRVGECELVLVGVTASCPRSTPAARSTSSPKTWIRSSSRRFAGSASCGTETRWTPSETATSSAGPVYRDNGRMNAAANARAARAALVDDWSRAKGKAASSRRTPAPPSEEDEVSIRRADSCRGRPGQPSFNHSYKRDRR
jgi:hypothetical protein